LPGPASARVARECGGAKSCRSPPIEWIKRAEAPLRLMRRATFSVPPTVVRRRRLPARRQKRRFGQLDLMNTPPDRQPAPNKCERLEFDCWKAASHRARADLASPNSKLGQPPTLRHLIAQGPRMSSRLHQPLINQTLHACAELGFRTHSGFHPSVSRFLPPASAGRAQIIRLGLDP